MALYKCVFNFNFRSGRPGALVQVSGKGVIVRLPFVTPIRHCISCLNDGRRTDGISGGYGFVATAARHPTFSGRRIHVATGVRETAAPSKFVPCPQI